MKVFLGILYLFVSRMHLCAYSYFGGNVCFGPAGGAVQVPERHQQQIG